MSSLATDSETITNLMKGKAFSIYGLSFSELRLSPPLSGMPISMICARDLSKAQGQIHILLLATKSKYKLQTRATSRQRGNNVETA